MLQVFHQDYAYSQLPDAFLVGLYNVEISNVTPRYCIFNSLTDIDYIISTISQLPYVIRYYIFTKNINM